MTARKPLFGSAVIQDAIDRNKSSSGKQYPEEVREAALRLYVEKGLNYAQVGKHADIVKLNGGNEVPAPNISRWVEAERKLALAFEAEEAGETKTDETDANANAKS